LKASVFVVLLCRLLFATAASNAAELSDDGTMAAALVAAYPDFISAGDHGELRWRDGTTLPWGTSRQFDGVPANVRDATLREQLYYLYPLAPWSGSLLPDDDPGRLRNQDFFFRMYGDCRKGEVQRRLRTVIWLRNTAPQRIQVTTINGIDKAVENLSAEIEQLPPRLRVAATRLSGGFVCRAISGTNSRSMHGYGAAIDLRTSVGRYWRWSGLKPAARKFNLVPEQIVSLFEKYGFIWGGKWYHVDGLHFEYRPELIEYSKRAGSVKADYLEEHPL
jgi:hypothetical protein